MISRSDDYVEYCRETAKRARDLHDLALRGRHKKEATRLIHERIVEAVELRPDDDLVDIGCGDGTLLRMAQQAGVRSALGILAAEEEVALVSRTGVQVRQGFTDQLPIAAASASVLVCNNVLLIVPREKIPASLREMCRIARTGARIFIGEIPFAEQHDPTPQFRTRGENTLISISRTWLASMVWDGAPDALVAAHRSTRSDPPRTAVSFFAPAEEFVALARSAGLELVRQWQHHDPDDRNNYLLRKPMSQEATLPRAI